jgi:hypothetical protein
MLSVIVMTLIGGDPRAVSVCDGSCHPCDKPNSEKKPAQEQIRDLEAESATLKGVVDALGESYLAAFFRGDKQRKEKIALENQIRSLRLEVTALTVRNVELESPNGALTKKRGRAFELAEQSEKSARADDNHDE